MFLTLFYIYATHTKITSRQPHILDPVTVLTDTNLSFIKLS